VNVGRYLWQAPSVWALFGCRRCRFGLCRCWQRGRQDPGTNNPGCQASKAAVTSQFATPGRRRGQTPRHGETGLWFMGLLHLIQASCLALFAATQATKSPSRKAPGLIIARPQPIPLHLHRLGQFLD
jgi:hypothetical protein